MWVSNEKSLRTKRRAEAIDKAEEMYFDLQNELKDGRKLFSVSIADAVAIYLEHRKIDVRTKEIVEGRWVTTLPFICVASKYSKSRISPFSFTTLLIRRFANNSLTLKPHKCVSSTIALFRSACA